MPIRVKMLYFGQARDGSGTAEESLALDSGSSVAELVEAVVKKHPALGGLRPTAKFAVNEEVARASEKLKDGDVVAMLPPVAGG